MFRGGNGRAAASAEEIAAHRVANAGPSCTAASVLTALGALGARNLPDLATATMILNGSSVAYSPPGFFDYVAGPRHKAPLDERIEKLAAASGLKVKSTTRICAVPWRLRGPRAGEMVIAHVAWGTEAPGRRGTWGFRPLKPSTLKECGHSVVVAGNLGLRWAVVDPNLPGVQVWPQPVFAPTQTRIRLLG